MVDFIIKISARHSRHFFLSFKNLLIHRTFGNRHIKKDNNQYHLYFMNSGSFTKED